MGIDVGTFSIKCVEITRDSGVPRLTRADLFPVQPGKDTLAHIQGLGLDATKSVRISLSGPSVLIRRLVLPSMTAAELKGAIQFQAESQLPISVEDYQLDSQILGQPDKKTMSVLLVAAKKELVHERLKLFSSLEIHPHIIDVDIFCLLNAFQLLEEAEAKKNYGLLNIGHKSSSFIIVQNGAPFFVREIGFGGQQVTQALAATKGIPEAEAAALKTKKPAEAAKDLQTATEKGFEALLDEVKHSIDYFENEAGDDLKKVWISGGGALSQGSAAFFSEGLGREASLWRPTKSVELAEGVDAAFFAEHGPEFHVALGMALRGAGHIA